jgi:hypothetical protein
MLALSKEDFDRLRNISPAFDKACRDLTRVRLAELEKYVAARHEQAVPEAVHMGKASAVGLSTLAGFLAAISFNLLE